MDNKAIIENRGGIIIIFLIAFFGFTKVISGNVEEKIEDARNNHLSYSDWYGSKGIKQVLKEKELHYLQTLRSLGIIDPERNPIFETRLKIVKNLIKKYEAEKTEILSGSANIEISAWAQDLNGEFGKIIGLNEWERILENFTEKLSMMEIGQLLVQLALIFGVVGLIIYDNSGLQKSFTALMVASGLAGLIVFFYAYVM